MRAYRPYLPRPLVTYIPIGNRKAISNASQGLVRYQAGSRLARLGNTGGGGLQLVIPNFYVNAAGKFTRISANWLNNTSIRYPPTTGTVYHLTKDGSVNITCDVSQPITFSDVLDLDLPDDAAFDLIFNNDGGAAILPCGAPVNSTIDTYYGHNTIPPPVNPTIAGASVGQTGSGYAHVPWIRGVARSAPAIVGVVLGDSRAFGANAPSATTTGDVSGLDQTFNPDDPILNLAVSGRRAEHYTDASCVANTGGVSSTTLTVTTATVGTIAAGQKVYGFDPSGNVVADGVVIQSLGTSTGGTGTVILATPITAPASSTFAMVRAGMDDLVALLSAFSINRIMDELAINDLSAGRSFGIIRACKFAIMRTLTGARPQNYVPITIFPRVAPTPVTALTSVGTTATATVASTAQLTTGQNVTIAGATPSAYNGTYVATVISATQFTYTFAGGTSPATGTITIADGYTTLFGQSLYNGGAIETARLALNAAARAGTLLPGVSLHLDSASAVADPTDAGKVRVDGGAHVDDGLHQTVLGHLDEATYNRASASYAALKAGV